jgi:hypothetical protein
MAQRLVACYQWIKAAGVRNNLYLKISSRSTSYKKMSQEPTLANNKDAFGDHVPLLD